MYLPLAAVVVLVVIAGDALISAALSRRPGPAWLRPALGTSLTILTVTVLALLTLRRNEDYQSGLAMYRDVVAKRPANFRARGNLAATYLGLGRTQDARQELAEALRLARPTRPIASCWAWSWLKPAG